MRAARQQIQKIEGFYHPSVSNNDISLDEETNATQVHRRRLEPNPLILTTDDLSVIRGVRLIHIAIGCYAAALYAFVLNDYRKLGLQDEHRSVSIGLIFLSVFPLAIQVFHFISVFFSSITNGELDPSFPIFMESHITLSYIILLVPANPRIHRKHDCLHQTSPQAGLHCDLLAFNYYYIIVLVLSNLVTFAYAAAYYRAAYRRNKPTRRFSLLQDFALWYFLGVLFIFLPIWLPAVFVLEYWKDNINPKIRKVYDYMTSAIHHRYQITRSKAHSCWYWISWRWHVACVWCGLKRMKATGGVQEENLESLPNLATQNKDSYSLKSDETNLEFEVGVAL